MSEVTTADADVYLTVDRPTEFETKVKGSRFIGWARPVEDGAQAEAVLAEVRRTFHDATHHCYAFRIGWGPTLVLRASDGGEPAGTAGRPILSAIEARGLTNTIVVVTRYFGGVKLGMGGLARAYGQCAAETLQRAGVRRCYVTRRLVVRAPHALHGALVHLVRQLQGEVVASTFAQEATLVVTVRASRREEFAQRVAELSAGQATVREA
ncbi:MAG: IMPACT family protein [candidate division KSB1 bacterium]|nr:IMPACT family protein [candidate division KSB1 bacterium]